MTASSIHIHETIHCDFFPQLLYYRVSINSFPDYKYLLQENYAKYKHILLLLLKLVSKKLLELSYILKKKTYVCIPRGFLVINVCNQGKILCSPCIFNFIMTSCDIFITLQTLLSEHASWHMPFYSCSTGDIIAKSR